MAGAACVGLGTGLFYDPLVCEKINEGVSSYLDRHGLEQISDLTGSLSLNT